MTGENQEKKDKSKLFQALMKEANKAPIYKTPKNILKKFIWHHVNHPKIFIGQKKISEDLKIGLRTVVRSMKILYEAGYITKLTTKSHYKTNVYILNLQAISLAPFAQQSRCGTKKVACEMSYNIYRNYIPLSLDLSLQNPSETEPLKTEKRSHYQSKKEGKVVNMYQLTEEDSQTAQEMIQIMSDATSGVVVPNPEHISSTPRKLVFHLKNKFGNDMRRWRSFCKSVGSSYYLMSGKNGFVPALLWLIKDEIVQKIRSGEFHKNSLRTGHQNIDSKQSFAHNPSSFDDEGFISQRINADATIESISEDQKKVLAQQYEQNLINEPNTWLGQEFKYNGWDSSFVKSCFDDFMIRSIQQRTNVYSQQNRSS
jgi:hypothetical protein